MRRKDEATRRATTWPAPGEPNPGISEAEAGFEKWWETEGRARSPKVPRYVVAEVGSKVMALTCLAFCAGAEWAATKAQEINKGGK